MSYFDYIFKKRVKEVIKEMAQSGEIIIDNNEIFITDGYKDKDKVVFVPEFEMIDNKEKKDDTGNNDT